MIIPATISPNPKTAPIKNKVIFEMKDLVVSVPIIARAMMIDPARYT